MYIGTVVPKEYIHEATTAADEYAELTELGSIFTEYQFQSTSV